MSLNQAVLKIAFLIIFDSSRDNSESLAKVCISHLSVSIAFHNFLQLSLNTEVSQIHVEIYDFNKAF